MGKNNNNAGLHMIYYSKSENIDSFDENYYVREYNTPEYRQYMNNTLLMNLTVFTTTDRYHYGYAKGVIWCDNYKGIHKCSCGAELRYIKKIPIYSYFEKGKASRLVEGFQCDECKKMYLNKDLVLTKLKRNLEF